MPAGMESFRSPAPSKTKQTAVLEIRNLTVDFTGETVSRALSGFGYVLAAGEKLAIVGESGCGKTVHALAVLGLLDRPPAAIRSGEIIFNGRDLLKTGAEELRKIRGARIAMIFQDPMTSFNPVLPVGYQVAEAITAHTDCAADEARKKAVRLLEETDIPDAAARYNDYPHQFSGGMLQRAMIAMALACQPEVLIADEPTTSLDVTVQAQILKLIDRLCKEKNMALVLITHNLGIVAHIADRVAVVYAGSRVEEASVEELFKNPLHPYTKGLLDSIPSLQGGSQRLRAIPGQPPAADQKLEKCPFAPRCASAWDKCRAVEPPEFSGGGHICKCWLMEGKK